MFSYLFGHGFDLSDRRYPPTSSTHLSCVHVLVSLIFFFYSLHDMEIGLFFPGAGRRGDLSLPLFLPH